jgi:mannose-6-phosphate isomerase-like protein (cupin superfamily)
MLGADDVYFAMPCGDGQLSSGQFKGGIVAQEDLAPDQPLCVSDLEIPHNPDQQLLFTAIHTIKAMMNEARVVLNTDFEAEFSHHYGLAKFRDWGATIISCVNRSYCKKLVIQTPGQRHPSHYHKRKEETFQVLHGVLEVEIDGRRRTLHPGDTLLVQEGVWHQFWTESGVIFEEISTTHYNDDSFYEDKEINRLDRSERKTVVNHWGRYQI